MELGNEGRAKRNIGASEGIVQSTGNKADDKGNMSKLTINLKGLAFPTDKGSILSYLMQRPSNGNNHNHSEYIFQEHLVEFWETNLYEIENLLLIFEESLTDNQHYSSLYEIEKGAGLLQEK